MAYVAQEARQELLDEIAVAIDVLAAALGAVGDAYEALDELSGDALEAQLFRPLQTAYGRAKRTHSSFAQRHGLPERTFEAAKEQRASIGTRGFLEQAADDVAEADQTLADLQDSMRPVEIGDPELRAGLGEVRTMLGPLVEAAEHAIARFGR